LFSLPTRCQVWPKEAALEISRRRRDILERLREALTKNNTDEALALARQYCGLEDTKTDA
jgi:hypothetical protein